MYMSASAKRALIFPSYVVRSITAVAFPLSAGVMMMSSACFRLLMAFCSAGERLVWGGLALAKHPVILVLASCASADPILLRPPSTAATMSGTGILLGAGAKFRPFASTSPPCDLDKDVPMATVTLPYIRHLSECIRRILTPLGIRTCFRPHCTLRQSLVRVKDPTPAPQRTGVVYRIPCGNCLKVYIGQTSRTLKHRLTEHKRALRSGEAVQSAVAEHAMEEDHTIKWEDAEVVDHNPRYRQRCTLEAWHIRTERHKMNRDEGSLPGVYNPLVHLYTPS